MKNIIVGRCCGNCEWSISPENEHDIMIENSYDEDDPTRPKAGDCCLGMEHNEDYVCKHHEYLSGGLETYTFFDNKDKEPGYFVVDTYYDHVLKYFKLYRKGEYGNYSYGIRVYDLYPVRDIVNGVSFEISKYNNELLYKAITIFSKALDKNVMWDIDKKNFITTNVYEDCTCLYFTGSNDNNVIDIKIDRDINDRNYKLISHLFRNMAVVTSNKKNDLISKKIRKINK